MNRTEAASLARQLINQYLNQDRPAGSGPWTFQFDRAAKRFGQCNYTKQTISLSERLVVINERPVVLETILHEIAHATAARKFGNAGKGHGTLWEREFQALLDAYGIPSKASRCYDAPGRNIGQTVNKPKAPWLLVCPTCRKEQPRFRRTNTRYYCRTCLARNGRQFVTAVRLQLVPNRSN